MKQKATAIGLPMSVALDAIRFLAACLVLLHHAGFEKLGTKIPWRLTQTGAEPVIAFFVLSGFVVALAAETRDRRAADYALNRAARLLSVAAPALILTVALDSVGETLFPALYGDQWRDAATVADLNTPPAMRFVIAATFVNEIWTLNLWPGTNSPFWSLGYEAFYYVLFGVAFYAEANWRRSVGLGLVCLVAGPKILLLLPVWLMGVAAWRLYQRATPTPLAGGALCVASIAAYIAFMTSCARAVLDQWTDIATGRLPESLLGLSNHFPSNYVSGFLFAAVLFGFKGLEAKVAGPLAASAPWIRAAAACTFSMYLFHYPLLFFFRALAAELLGREDLTVRSWSITAIVLIGTGATIGLLARVTEQKKAEVREMIAAALPIFRPSPII